MSSTVLTMGTFDLPHSGHTYLFRQCRRIAGFMGTVVVGLNPDQFILQFKKKLPIQSYEERKSILESSKYIDQILPTPGPDAKPLIDQIQPDFLVIGSDWAHKNYYEQLQITQDWLLERDIALLYLDRVGTFSSTELKERIRAS